MAKKIRLVIVMIIVVGLFGCSDNTVSVSNEVEPLLSKANAEIFYFKYEFEVEPYVLLLFKDDAMLFRIDKSSLESKEYDKSLQDNGGIIFVLGNQETSGTYKASRKELALDGKVNTEAKKDMEHILEKYDLNQELVFKYLIEYATDHLLKELPEDKKTYKDLLLDNKYTVTTNAQTVSISYQQYIMDITGNTSGKEISSASIYNKDNNDIQFIIPGTMEAGKNLVKIVSKNIVYDLDSGKVVNGTDSILENELELANVLKEECYKMLRYLHINNYETLQKFYSENR